MSSMVCRISRSQILCNDVCLTTASVFKRRLGSKFGRCTCGTRRARVSHTAEGLHSRPSAAKKDGKTLEMHAIGDGFTVHVALNEGVVKAVSWCCAILK